MTTEDQIKDEKLQYDINREAVKISALSSSKIDKYEYLTGEEILPTNQQQIIEQAKFTYSPLGKSFQKQTKTIEDQGEKQIKAIQDKRSIKSIEKFNYDIKYSPIVLKEKEIYNKLTEESFEKINNLDKKFKNKLVFKYKGNTPNEDCSGFDNAFELVSKIRDGEVSLSEAKDEQAKLKLKIEEIKKLRNKYILKESREAKINVENLCNTSKATIDFFDEYTSRASEARRQAKQGRGLKTLTLNQMLKRLPIALAQIKPGNNSESLLNEIRQIVYSLYRSKEITKKVYNNMIKSIKV